MIQPLVENAIWHGLMHVEGKKKIRIAFTLDKNKINCSIEDNGIGILKSEKLKQNNKTQHRSVGLDNLRNRIKIMNEKYDTDCSLEISDLSQNGGNHTGTLVVLRLNVINL
jgi:sensor histidine kinase YesM